MFFFWTNVLSNDSMWPTKSKHIGMGKSYFGRHKNMLKKMKQGATGAFQETNQKITEAS